MARVLRPRLLAAGFALQTTDLAATAPAGTGEKTSAGDLRRPDVADAVLLGATVAIHLAGTSVERPLPEIIENNLVALHQLYEGARRHGVRRIIFASSNHTIGMYPAGQPLSPADAVRPDGFYGLSKVWGEAMGRLYWDKHGIETIGLRIGSALPRPTEPRHLSTWLGEDDMVALFTAAITAPAVGFQIVWGVSANAESWWDNDAAAAIGYAPRQNAADYADEILGRSQSRPRYQGGDFALDGMTLEPAGEPT
ncbi:MAG: epimerase [Rhodospirillales bacterium 20-64-7]|nr:MAG: epimerase [Rhodospirillales bacterium 20-64-7]